MKPSATQRERREARLALLEGLGELVLAAWVVETEEAYPDLRASLGDGFYNAATESMNEALVEMLRTPEVALHTLSSGGVDLLVGRLVAATWENIEKRAAPPASPTMIVMEDSDGTE